MKYRISRKFVSTDLSKRIVINKDTGETFELTSEALELISFFREPHSFEEYFSTQKICSDKKEEIEEFLQVLEKQQILIEATELEETPLVQIDEPFSVEVFLKKTNLSFCNVPMYYQRDIQQVERGYGIIGVPFDAVSTGLSGSKFGPKNIRESSVKIYSYNDSLATGKAEGWHVEEDGTYLLEGNTINDFGDVIIFPGESFENTTDKIYKSTSLLLKNNYTPVLLGGDHSISYGSVKALVEKYGDNFYIIHFDAHTDLAELVKGRHHHHGNVFTRIMSEFSSLHLYQFGVRGPAGSTPKEIGSNYKRFLPSEINEWYDLFKQSIPEKAKCYISLDIDVIDPAYAPGTGTPVHFGVLPNDLRKFLAFISKRIELIGVDIVEVNPQVDIKDTTSALATDLLLSIIGNNNLKI